LAFLLTLPALSFGATYQLSRVVPPKPNREFRAAWIATVANLDWPTTNSVKAPQQKAELIAELDRAAQLKLNAVIFQVRPACDAMYPSTLEPWSEYLTGIMGKAPEPYYDPLAFAIEEAHKRGLELHAWFNPYRARHMQARSAVSSNHISRTRPDLVRQAGKFLWLDPGEREVRDYSLKVVMDVVKRYDIDGVHFDDYFYPDMHDLAPGKDFDDNASWAKYGAASKLSRGDWRRENVNRFIQRVYASIKAAKPWVKFGISPSGIWRPKYPPQIKGKDGYEDIYADSRLWLANGWVDYLAPQLYWAIDPPEHSFPALLSWWSAQNVKSRVLCPGVNTYNLNQTWRPEEIANQIRITRRQPGAAGNIHWRMSTLMQNRGAIATLERLYGQPALPPAFPWLGGGTLAKPGLSFHNPPKGNRTVMDWTPGPGGTGTPWLWLLQTRTHGNWSSQVLPASRSSFTFYSQAPEYIALTAVDRNGNLGPASVMQRLDRRD
jgi:uncharacterized lipoprotein YddW (UPF0748 family)